MRRKELWKSTLAVKLTDVPTGMIRKCISGSGNTYGYPIEERRYCSGGQVGDCPMRVDMDEHLPRCIIEHYHVRWKE
jgi:hypothetical protein